MEISFLRPLELAIERMKLTLLRPFNIETWLVLGFAAFLAGLDRTARQFSYTIDGSDRSIDVERFEGAVWEFLTNFFLLGFVGFLVVLGIVLQLVLLWVGSRGKFILLDNLVQDRVAIVEPWGRFRRLGDSLFLWRLAFFFVALALGVLIVVPSLLAAGAVAGLTRSGLIGFGALMVWSIVLVLYGLSIGYVSLFLENFVVPLMYRDDLTAMAAWRRFFDLFRSRPGPFLLFGVIVFGLAIAIVIAIFFAGIVTCCIGWLLVAMPYVGTVVLLPVWVAYRYYGPEFLAQFGPEFTVLRPRPGTPPGAPPGASSNGLPRAPSNGLPSPDPAAAI